MPTYNVLFDSNYPFIRGILVDAINESEAIKEAHIRVKEELNRQVKDGKLNMKEALHLISTRKAKTVIPI